MIKSFRVLIFLLLILVFLAVIINLNVGFLKLSLSDFLGMFAL